MPPAKSVVPLSIGSGGEVASSRLVVATKRNFIPTVRPAREAIARNRANPRRERAYTFHYANGEYSRTFARRLNRSSTDDHRRGWSEAYPAVARRANALPSVSSSSSTFISLSVSPLLLSSSLSLSFCFPPSSLSHSSSLILRFSLSLRAL